jgi:hypothetical protein
VEPREWNVRGEPYVNPDTLRYKRGSAAHRSGFVGASFVREAEEILGLDPISAETSGDPLRIPQNKATFQD